MEYNLISWFFGKVFDEKLLTKKEIFSVLNNFEENSHDYLFFSEINNIINGFFVFISFCLTIVNFEQNILFLAIFGVIFFVFFIFKRFLNSYKINEPKNEDQELKRIEGFIHFFSKKGTHSDANAIKEPIKFLSYSINNNQKKKKFENFIEKFDSLYFFGAVGVLIWVFPNPNIDHLLFILAIIRFPIILYQIQWNRNNSNIEGIRNIVQDYFQDSVEEISEVFSMFPLQKVYTKKNMDKIKEYLDDWDALFFGHPGDTKELNEFALALHDLYFPEEQILHWMKLLNRLRIILDRFKEQDELQEIVEEMQEKLEFLLTYLNSEHLYFEKNRNQEKYSREIRISRLTIFISLLALVISIFK